MEAAEAVVLPAAALALLVADGLVADANDPEEPRLMLRRPGFLGRRDRRAADGGGGRAEGILVHFTCSVQCSFERKVKVAKVAKVERQKKIRCLSVLNLGLPCRAAAPSSCSSVCNGIQDEMNVGLLQHAAMR